MRNIADLTNGVTHNGVAHSDDLASSAFLRKINPNLKIIRTRENIEKYQKCDKSIVYDIGHGEYDHHQKDKKIRDYGIPYSSIGLLWKDYAENIFPKEVAKKVDEILIEKIDAFDNGYYRLDEEIRETCLQAMVGAMNGNSLSLKDDPNDFNNLVDFFGDVIDSYVGYSKFWLEKKSRGNEITPEVLQNLKENFGKGLGPGKRERYFTPEEVISVAIAKEDYKNKKAIDILDDLVEKYAMNLTSDYEFRKIDTSKFYDIEYTLPVDDIWEDFGGKRYDYNIFFKIRDNVLYEIKDRQEWEENSVERGTVAISYNKIMNAFNYLDCGEEERFEKAVKYSRLFLKNKIQRIKTDEMVTEMLEKPKNKIDDNIILNFPHHIPYKATWNIEGNSVITPLKNHNGYKVTILQKKSDYYRKFPDEWRGVQEEDFPKASNNPDAIFCSYNGKFAGAKTMSGAIELSNQIVEDRDDDDY